MDHIPARVLADMVDCVKQLKQLCEHKDGPYFAPRDASVQALMSEFSYDIEDDRHECNIACFSKTGWLDNNTVWFACRSTGRLHRCTEESCNAALLKPEERVCPLTLRTYPLHEHASAHFGRPNEVTDTVTRFSDANPTAERKRAKEQTAMMQRILATITSALVRCQECETCECCSAYATVTTPDPLARVAEHADLIWRVFAEQNTTTSSNNNRRGRNGATTQTYKYEYHILVAIMHTRTGFKVTSGRRRYTIVAEDELLARHLPQVADLLSRIKPRDNRPSLQPGGFTQTQNKFASFVSDIVQSRNTEALARISQQIQDL